MGYLYFDESIHDRAGFILGAMVYSSRDLTPIVHSLWSSLGLDPTRFEYKSSTPKAGNPDAQRHRANIHSLIHETQFGLLVCPNTDRRILGLHAMALAYQLVTSGRFDMGPQILHLDENIAVPQSARNAASSNGISVLVEQDSCLVGGLQVADHVAHSLSGMLLEKMGHNKKMVEVGPGSGYDPDLTVELGFELWASLRHCLITGPDSASLEDDKITSATFPVEGYGLYIAPTCTDQLRSHAAQRFGSNYIGCIH